MPAMSIISASQAAGPNQHGDRTAIVHDSASVWVGVLLTVLAAGWYVPCRYRVPPRRRPAPAAQRADIYEQ